MTLDGGREKEKQKEGGRKRRTENRNTVNACLYGS